MAAPPGGILDKGISEGSERMKRPSQKDYLKSVYRPPPDTTNRLEYIRLDKNECSLQLPPHVLDTIRQSITPEFLGCYPEVYKLYEALSAFHNYADDRFLIAAGSDGAIRAAYDAFVNAGDDVINIQPNFAMYDVYTRLHNANPVDLCYHPTSLTLDTRKVAEHIGDKTALLVLSNPNSPVGTEIPLEDIRYLLEKAEKYGTRVVIDEAYYPFSDNTSAGLLDSHKNLILLRTFSKAFGLAGIRVGYAISSKENIDLMGKFKPMYEVNTLAVLCACAYLDQYQVIEQSVKESLQIKKEFIDTIESFGFSAIPGSPNFVNVIVGKKNVQCLVDIFKDNRILIRPGYSYGILEECIRISVGTRSEMATAADLISRWKHAA
jgi:histidinol-phosphate aminotransferase